MHISKTKIGIFSRLENRKQRLKAGLFTAEGAKCVADTIGHFEVEAIVALPDWIARSPQYAHLEVLEADEADMKRISQLQTVPEVIAVYRLPVIPDPDTDKMKTGLTLLLDSVQDPGNLGTIIRTASWFGVSQVVLGVGCVDPFNQKTVMSSMGAIGMVSLAQADLCSLIDANKDIPVYGTLLDGKNIYDAELKNPAFIAMGNEGNGLSEAVRDRVTSPLLIPSFANGPHAESLNVAAATAITLSEFQRRELAD